MTLGEKLQQLRKAQKMSQEELASKITVSRQAVSKWELNEAIPDTENIIQLSKILGVSIDFLLNDEIESVKEIPVVKETTIKLKKKYNNLWAIVLIISIIIALFIGNAVNVEMTVGLALICLSIIIVIGLLINLIILILKRQL